MIIKTNINTRQHQLSNKNETKSNQIRQIKHNVEIGTPGEMLLERILEEESIYGDERLQREYINSPNENDKKHLLGNGHTVNVNITRI